MKHPFGDKLLPMSLDRYTDTIVAPITAVGGAVGIVRLSGADSWRIVKLVFDGFSCEPEPRVAVYGHFSSGDDGLATPFAEGSSYTGEQTIEMSVHGSPASMQSLVDLCLDEGARLAEPGEFTLRAFLNGRIDLTQAEGVRDTVEAQTESQLRQANLLRDGALKQTVSSIHEILIGIVASIEASTDFSEEVGEVDCEKAVAECDKTCSAISALLETADTARLTRQGLSIAILGLPNAGKSSLLNAVLKSDRAIVTDIPGTTRDTVEECVSINGTLCRIIDTAGLRETDDPIEKIGVERTRDAANNADIAWYVYDSALGWSEQDDEAQKLISAQTVIVANKCDLSNSLEKGLAVSATIGTGLAELMKTVLPAMDAGTNSAVVNQRHTPLLDDAKTATNRAKETLLADIPNDLAVVDLQTAIRSLGEITGETTPPDVIDRIFHDFCIGK